MKKILVIISFMLLGLSVVSCGKYDPKLSKLGVMYNTTEYTNEDGSYPTIIIKEVVHDGKNIIVKTESPFEHVQYALNNFLSVSLLDEKGNSYDDVKIDISKYDEQAILKITGKEDLSSYKYIKIYPYSGAKDEDNSCIEFEIK